MPKQTIAVDLDDVLAQSVADWVVYSNRRWGTAFTVEDYDEDWRMLWGVNDEEHKRRSMHLFESGLFGSFQRFEEAEAILKKLSRHYKLVVATSRVERLRDETLAWVNRHFGDIFHEIHLTGFYDEFREDAPQLTKVELLQSIGADYLIDDLPKHCLAAAKAGIPAILFGDYSWNRHVNLTTGVTRCRDWPAVGEYFDAL